MTHLPSHHLTLGWCPENRGNLNVEFPESFFSSLEKERVKKRIYKN